MTSPLVAPSLVPFRSVERPELVLEEDDVFVCDCVEYGWDPDRCPDCKGHRILHGYTQGGRGLPVELAERNVDLHALYRAQGSK